MFVEVFSSLQRHLAVVSVSGVLASVGCSLLVDTAGLSAGPSDASAPASGTSDAGADGAAIIDASVDAGVADAADAGPSIAQVYAAAVLSDGPSMYLQLDEKAGNAAADASGGPSRIYFGSFTHGVPGAFPGSMAMGLDGATGGINAGPVFDFDGLKPFTLEAWHRSRKIDTVYRFVFAKDVMDSMGLRQEYGIFLHSPEGACFERYVDGGSASTRSAPVPIDGDFHHLVTIYDGAKGALFVDAVLIGTFNDTRSAATKPKSLYVGTHDSGYGTLFGDLDEVAVYEKVLTPARILAHYHAAGR
jgi:hypothetical protein